MFVRLRAALIGCALMSAGVLLAQTTPPPPTPPKATLDVPPPTKDVVAVRVNGQAIPELAVYRGLMSVRPELREATRKEVVNFLIDNTIVDQYLIQLKLPIEPKEVEAKIDEMKAEAKKEGKDWKALLEKLIITEDELRSETTSALRWDKFVLQQGTDKVLMDTFQKNIEMFNGSRVKARHILVAVDGGKKEAALATASAIRKSIDDQVTQAVAKLPTGDAITREKQREGVLDKAFAEAAIEKSTCPSKKEGGDLGYFARAGAMVEPFAKAAFALKPFQLSDPVATEFGYHLILVVDTKPGKEVKFEQVKPFVQEVYGERLREAILTHYKSKSKIEIVEQKK